IPTKPSTSKPYKKHKPKKQQTQAPKVPSPEPLPEPILPSPSNDPLPSGKDSLKLKELIDLCTQLSNKVLELESKVIDIKSAYKERIKKLEGRVDRLEEENKVLKELHNIDKDVKINLEEAQAKPYRMDLEHPEKVLSIQDVDDEEPTEVEEVLEVVTTAKLITEVVTTAGATTTTEATKVSVTRRRRGVVIQDPEETTSTVVVHSEVQSKDKGNGIFIKEPKSLKGQAQTEQDEAFARQLEAELNADINWNAIIEQIKRSERLNDAMMKYQALKKKPLTKAQARKNIIIYLKNMTGYKMNYFKGMTYKATHLASKFSIFDYKIYLERNKPYFKIIRADGNHMLFLSFSTLLKNFDKEDLESLWKLVKEMFKKTEPKNYTNDYLLKTLKTMFEQPDVKPVYREIKRVGMG
nr:hypothetical protein [Tanacetum cinerariifolium]